MSEFECKYGHLMRPGGTCTECEAEGRFGVTAYRMDGMTARQLVQMERADAARLDYERNPYDRSGEEDEPETEQ